MRTACSSNSFDPATSRSVWKADVLRMPDPPPKKKKKKLKCPERGRYYQVPERLNCRFDMSAKLFSAVKRCEPKRAKGSTDRFVQTACLERQTIGFPRIIGRARRIQEASNAFPRKRVDDDSLAKRIWALQGTMFAGGSL